MGKIHFNDVKLEYVENMKGWVGPDGFFYGDGEKAESAARYANCDVRTCETDGCDNHTPKLWNKCECCRRQAQLERWRKAEKRPVSKEDVAYYSELSGSYVYDIDEEVLQFGTAEEALLYHCELSDMPQLCLNDIYDGVTPEGGDIHYLVESEVVDALNSLNAAMLANPISSYGPSKVAVLIESEV